MIIFGEVCFPLTPQFLAAALSDHMEGGGGGNPFPVVRSGSQTERTNRKDCGPAGMAGMSFRTPRPLVPNDFSLVSKEGMKKKQKHTFLKVRQIIPVHIECVKEMPPSPAATCFYSCHLHASPPFVCCSAVRQTYSAHVK